MASYLVKRFLRSFITLIIILSIVFILVRQMPIDGYFQNFEKLNEAQIQNGLHEMGLDRPIFVQLFDFFKNLVLHGDLGTSRIYRAGVPVAEILAPKIPVSVRLGTLSLLVSLVLGLPMGLVMAKYKGRFLDHLGTAIIVLIEAVPAAVYYLFLQFYGTSALGIGMTMFSEADLHNPVYWILPVLSMSLGNMTYYAMWLRRYMVDESMKDYVTLARIKGASETRIMFLHVFKNAFVPMVQYIPTSFLNTVIGSIYVESLYSIPGMGGLLVDVVKRQDNAMVQAIVLLFATVGIIGLLLGDLLMVFMDPRISLAKKGGER